VEKCIDGCSSSGYTSAGLEWAQECCESTLLFSVSRLLTYRRGQGVGTVSFFRRENLRALKTVISLAQVRVEAVGVSGCSRQIIPNIKPIRVNTVEDQTGCSSTPEESDG
jgi:hypothetical protein